MKIRTAQLEDLDHLVALNQEVHDIHVQIEPFVFRETSEGFLKQSITKLLEDTGSIILVAEAEDIIVGYMLLQKRIRPEIEIMHERRCLYFDQVCVSKKHRQQGVFKSLLAKAKVIAKEHGFNRIELDVWSENDGAKRSFLNSGFVPYNEKMKIEL